MSKRRGENGNKELEMEGMRLDKFLSTPPLQGELPSPLVRYS